MSVPNRRDRDRHLRHLETPTILRRCEPREAEAEGEAAEAGLPSCELYGAQYG